MSKQFERARQRLMKVYKASVRRSIETACAAQDIHEGGMKVPDFIHNLALSQSDLTQEMTRLINEGGEPARALPSPAYRPTGI